MPQPNGSLGDRSLVDLVQRWRSWELETCYLRRLRAPLAAAAQIADTPPPVRRVPARRAPAAVVLGWCATVRTLDSRLIVATATVAPPAALPHVGATAIRPVITRRPMDRVAAIQKSSAAPSPVFRSHADSPSVLCLGVDGWTRRPVVPLKLFDGCKHRPCRAQWCTKIEAHSPCF